MGRILVLLLLLRAALGRAHEPVPTGPSPDARIALYSRRIHGAASYAAQTQLGLAYLAKARRAGNRGLYARAERELLGALAYQPNFDSYLGLAMICSDLHEFRQGLVYAEQAEALLPGHAEAEGVCFDLTLALGQSDRAATILQGMLEQKPGFHAWSRQSNLLEARGDFEGALAAVSKASHEAHERSYPAPIQAWTLTRVAVLQARTGAWADALDHCREALALNPTDRAALDLEARLLAQQGHLPEALAVARRLVRLREESRALLLEADLLAAVGKTSSAEESHRRAMELLERKAAHGDHSEMRPLALSLLDRDDSVKRGLLVAWEDWHRRPDPLATDLLGWAYLRNGRIGEAEPLCRQALSSGTRDPQVLLHAAVLEQALGRPEEAARWMNQARQAAVWLSWEEQRRWLTAEP